MTLFGRIRRQMPRMLLGSYFILLLTLLFFAFPSAVKTATNIPLDDNSLWIKSYDSGIREWSSGIISTSDGHFLIYGYTLDNAIGSNLVLKTNSSGTIQWNNIFRTASTGNHAALGAVEVDDGYVVGGVTNNGGGFDTSSRGWLAKLNKDTGEILDHHVFISEAGFEVNALAKTSDGIIVLGRTGENLLLMKVDSNLNYLWQRSYPSPSLLDANNWLKVSDIVQTADGGFVFAAYYIAEDIGINQWTIWVVKVNSEGLMDEQDTTWQKTIGDANTKQFVHALETTEEGGVLVGGSTSEYSTGQGVQRWILKLSASGEIVWQFTYGYLGSSSLDYVQDLRKIGQNHIFLGTMLDSGYIAQIDQYGEMQWERRYAANSYFTGGVETTEGDIIAVANNNANIDIFKLNSLGNIPSCQRLLDYDGSESIETTAKEIDLGISISGTIVSTAGQSEEVFGQELNMMTEDLCNFVRPLAIVQNSDLVETNKQLFPGGKAVFEITVKNNDSISTPPIFPYLIGEDPNNLDWQTNQFEENAVRILPGSQYTFRVPLFLDNNAALGTYRIESINLWDYEANAHYSDLPSGGYNQHLVLDITNPPAPFLDLPFDHSGKTFLEAIQYNLDSEHGEINSYYDHEYPSWKLNIDNPVSILLYTDNEYPGKDNCLSRFNRCYTQHNAIDFQNQSDNYDHTGDGQPDGDRILAAASGDVIDYCNTWIKNGTQPCKMEGGYGNYIVIKHSENGCYWSHYAHLASISYELLQRLTDEDLSNNYVSQGDIIGEMGGTGNYVDNPMPVHGHFGLYWYCEDPDNFDANAFEDHAVDPFGWEGMDPDSYAERTDPASSEVKNGVFPVSIWMWKLGSPQSKNIDTSGGEVSVGNVKISIPEGSLQTNAMVRLALLSTFKPVDVSRLRIGNPFKISINSLVGTEGSSNLISNLSVAGSVNAPFLVSVAYDGSSIQGIPIEKLIINQWNAATQTWLPLETVFNRENYTITAIVNEPGFFDVQAPAFMNFLPMISKP